MGRYSRGMSTVVLLQLIAVTIVGIFAAAAIVSGEKTIALILVSVLWLLTGFSLGRLSRSR